MNQPASKGDIMRIVLVLISLLIMSCEKTPDYNFSDMAGQWERTNGAYINYKASDGSDSIHNLEYWDFSSKAVKIYEERYIVEKDVAPEYHYTTTNIGDYRGDFNCEFDSDASGYIYFMVNIHRYSGSDAPVEGYGNYNSYIIQSMTDSTAVLYWLYETNCSDDGGDQPTYWGQIHLKRFDIDKMAKGVWVMH